MLDPSRGGGLARLHGSRGDVLYRAAGLGRRLTEPSFERSRREWLAEYDGGWDEVVPHPAEAGVWAGHRLGFLGDTARRPATVTADARSAVVRVESSTGLELERRVVLLEHGLRVESAVHHAAGRPVPWLQHALFAVEGETVVGTGDPGLDEQVNAALRRASAGFWSARASGEVRLGPTLIRWSTATWPWLWLWCGTDGDRGFLGVEPASCSPDLVVEAAQTGPVLTGWMEVTQP